MATKRSMRRRQRKLRRSRKQQRGGGYGDNPAHSIIPGQVIHAKYDGVGMDCAGSPQRAGALDGIGMLRAPGGLPGLSGGGRKRRGGGQLGSGGVVTDSYGKNIIRGGSYLGIAPQDAEMPAPSTGFKPAGELPKDPAGYTYQYMRQAQAQTGGRYGADLASAASVFGSNGVGYASLAPTGSVRCEAGSTNPLNADPALQMQTTNPNSSLVPGWAPRFNPLAGGSRKRRRYQKPSKKQQKKKLNQRAMKQSGGGTDAQNLANASPYYFAGQIDSMKYNAPTAGYGWQPLAPAVENNPGVNDQYTYRAGHMNQACVKTN